MELPKYRASNAGVKLRLLRFVNAYIIPHLGRMFESRYKPYMQTILYENVKSSLTYIS